MNHAQRTVLLSALGLILGTSIFLSRRYVRASRIDAPQPTIPLASDASIQQLQEAANTVEQDALDCLPVLRIRYGSRIPDAYYTAIHNDVSRLRNESVTDPDFGADVAQLDDDIDALNDEIKWVATQEWV